MEGILRANGEVIASLRKIKKIVGFVPQEDTMHRTLTVTEVLTFQANLRLPPVFTKKEISQKVSQVSSCTWPFILLLSRRNVQIHSDVLEQQPQ